MKMKRIILALTMLVAMVTSASAQAEIKFEKVVHDFGTFEETSPVQKATFTFTNVGNKPLVINQAIQLRLHGSILYQAAYCSWSEGADQCNL